MTASSRRAPNRWVLGARPRTLPAAIVPVFVGTACAWGFSAPARGWFDYSPNSGVLIDGHGSGFLHAVNWLNFCMALVVALALQVATNYANDYSDGKRGTDDPSKRVGPPRLVGNGLATAAEVKKAMIIAFGVALVAGGVLVVRVGWELIPVGIAAVAAGYFYTGGPKPYGYLGLGEAFVFVFFGVVATVGSTYVQLAWLRGSGLSAFWRVAGSTMWLSAGCSVAVGCLATALLVVNNLRDIPGDTRSGKRTLAVHLGDRRTRWLYLSLIVAPFVVLVFVGGLGNRPVASIAFGAVMVATQPILKVLSGAKGRDLIPVLGETGRLQMVFGALLTIGLVVSTYI